MVKLNLLVKSYIRYPSNLILLKIPCIYHAKMRASQAPIIEVPPKGINFDNIGSLPLIELT